MNYELIIIIAGIIAIAIILHLLHRRGSGSRTQERPKLHDFASVWSDYTSPERRAGTRGEAIAEEVIRSVLRPEDVLLTNVGIEFEEKLAELDCVVVNTCGVFIFEVKNYSGTLYGGVEDPYWEKEHVSAAGNTYWKSVRNPIGQVKRQIYLLASYLRYYGMNVWVEGFVILLNDEYPGDISKGRFLRIDSSSGTVQGSYGMLPEEIGRAVHTRGGNRLTRKTVERIRELLV